MPLLPALFLIGGGIATFFVSNAADKAAQSATNTPVSAEVNVLQGLPNWVVPSILVGIGGILLYKKGAKILHV